MLTVLAATAALAGDVLVGVGAQDNLDDPGAVDAIRGLVGVRVHPIVTLEVQGDVAIGAVQPTDEERANAGTYADLAAQDGLSPAYPVSRDRGSVAALVDLGLGPPDAGIAGGPHLLVGPTVHRIHGKTLEGDEIGPDGCNWAAGVAIGAAFDVWAGPRLGARFSAVDHVLSRISPWSDERRLVSHVVFGVDLTTSL